jgi:transcriptional regulator with XRE-family HTH domain
MVSYIQPNVELGTGNLMHIAQKFERLLETYRHLDGRRWTGQELDEATGGVVTRSYVTNLRKGRIENPGYEKLRAIAKVMNFSPELWFQEVTDSNVLRVENDDSANIAEKVNHLFKVIKNDTTGEPYTNTEVARFSLGDLTEEQVEQIRTGANSNPSVDQVVALADVFGVHPSYFLDRGKKPPVLDQEAMEILRDETLSAIAHKSLHLPDREREMILGIIQQFEETREDQDVR